ncbi:immune-related [Triplophysa rosa]|uniref:Immune-related n=1 Tax=Triplophysa rosa TaxID=992332 RepID=A0A9W7T2G2_TRIRA|nr:immune-related [Triplophysa rosa]
MRRKLILQFKKSLRQNNFLYASFAKRTKILLIVLAVSLGFALGVICGLTIRKTIKCLVSNRSREFVSLSCKPCEDGWTAHGGKCYFFSSEKQTWFKSLNSCETLKAHLVTINTRAVQGFLVSKIKETHWIGLNDLDTEGRWVWPNNQTLEETTFLDPIDYHRKNDTGQKCPRTDCFPTFFKISAFVCVCCITLCEGCLLIVDAAELFRLS